MIFLRFYLLCIHKNFLLIVVRYGIIKKTVSNKKLIFYLKELNIINNHLAFRDHLLQTCIEIISILLGVQLPKAKTFLI